MYIIIIPRVWNVAVCVCVSPSCSQYNIVVEDIMVREVKFISSQSTYREVKLLLDSSSLNSIPLVDSKGGAAHRERPSSMGLDSNVPTLWKSVW